MIDQKIDNVVLKDSDLRIENTISVEGEIVISGGRLVFSNRTGTIRGGCVTLESRYLWKKFNIIQDNTEIELDLSLEGKKKIANSEENTITLLYS